MHPTGSSSVCRALFSSPVVVFEDTRYSKEVVLQYFFLFKGKKVWIDFFGQVCVSAQNLQFQKKYQQKRIILSRVKNAALKNT